MKRNLTALLTLSLVSALLLTGCHDMQSVESTTTTTTASTTSSTTSSATTTATSVDDPPQIVPTYRPDVIWGGGWYQNPGHYLVFPGLYAFQVDFLNVTLPLDSYANYYLCNPEDRYKEFAVYFTFEFYLDEHRIYDLDALVNYLAESGIEEIGKEGGFSIPIFAMTIDQMEQLDCKNLIEIMDGNGLPADPECSEGLCIRIASPTETLAQEQDYIYSQLPAWTETEE